jgi:hypothetical protein
MFGERKVDTDVRLTKKKVEESGMIANPLFFWYSGANSLSNII